jgi:hypothetical protein
VECCRARSKREGGEKGCRRLLNGQVNKKERDKNEDQRSKKELAGQHRAKQTRGRSRKFLEERHTLYEFGIMYNIIRLA